MDVRFDSMGEDSDEEFGDIYLTSDTNEDIFQSQLEMHQRLMNIANTTRDDEAISWSVEYSEEEDVVFHAPEQKATANASFPEWKLNEAIHADEFSFIVKDANTSPAMIRLRYFNKNHEAGMRLFLLLNVKLQSLANIKIECEINNINNCEVRYKLGNNIQLILETEEYLYTNNQTKVDIHLFIGSALLDPSITPAAVNQFSLAAKKFEIEKKSGNVLTLSANEWIPILKTLSSIGISFEAFYNFYQYLSPDNKKPLQDIYKMILPALNQQRLQPAKDFMLTGGIILSPPTYHARFRFIFNSLFQRKKDFQQAREALEQFDINSINGCLRSRLVHKAIEKLKRILHREEIREPEVEPTIDQDDKLSSTELNNLRPYIAIDNIFKRLNIDIDRYIKSDQDKHCMIL